MKFTYNKAREKMLTKQFDWLNDVFKLMFVAIDYVPDRTHVYVSEIPSAAILKRSDALSSKAATDGYATGLPNEFLLYRNAAPVYAVIVYRDTGDDASSELVAYTDDGPALPFVGIGFNYTVTYNATLGGFFRA
jgi:hypothetical protein